MRSTHEAGQARGVLVALSRARWGLSEQQGEPVFEDARAPASAEYSVPGGRSASRTAPCARLVNLHAGCFYNFCPFRGFSADQLAEALRLAADGLMAVGDQPFAYLGNVDGLVELDVQPPDDLGRRSGGNQHAVP